MMLSAIGGVYLEFSLSVDDKERINVWNMFDTQPTIETLYIIIMIIFGTNGIKYQSSLCII
jgi:hypothetical protein